MAGSAVTLAMFIAVARGRLSVEIVSLLTIAVIAVGLYFFPLEGSIPTDGLALAFGGFGHYALITICSLMIMGRGLVVTGELDPAAHFLRSEENTSELPSLMRIQCAVSCLKEKNKIQN